MNKYELNQMSKPKIFTVTALNNINSTHEHHKNNIQTEPNFGRELRDSNNYKNNILISNGAFSTKNKVNLKKPFENTTYPIIHTEPIKSNKKASTPSFNTIGNHFYPPSHNQTQMNPNSFQTMPTNSVTMNKTNPLITSFKNEGNSKTFYNSNANMNASSYSTNSTKKSKKNFSLEIVQHNNVNKEEESDMLRRDQNNVVKLNYWDNDNLLTDINEFKKKLDVNNNNDYILNEIRKSLSKLNLKNTSGRLQDFYNESQKEQLTILLQNVNCTKRNFNFDEINSANQDFSFNRNSSNKNNRSVLNASSSQMGRITSKKLVGSKNNTGNKVFNMVQNDETLKKLYELNSEGTENLSKVEDYRQIIKEKTKIESSFLRDLNKIANQIFQKKKELQKLHHECRELNGEVQQMKDAQSIEKYRREKEVEELNNNHKHILEYLQGEIEDDETKFMREVEFKKKLDGKLTELYNIVNNENPLKAKYIAEHEEKMQIISKIENEVYYLKFALNSLTKDQRNYYYDILQKGIDVRTEGLTWVVKKLIELDAHLDYAVFPRFLDHSQIDYLLKISYKATEVTQTTIILKALKSKIKQNKLKEENDIMMMNSKNSLMTNVASSIPSGGNKTGLESVYSSASHFYLKSFSSKIIQIFDNIYKNNNSMTRTSFEQRIEDVSVDFIVQSLRKKIKMIDGDEDHILEQVDNDRVSLIKFFQEHRQQMDFFKDFVFLKDKVKELEKGIKTLKDEEIKKLAAKKEGKKMTHEKQKIAYDIIYAAIFGNGIAI